MVAYTKHDLLFILEGIQVSEAHADATNSVVGNTWIQADIDDSRQILTDLLPNSLEPIGMRTIDGSLNNLVPGQDQFGSVDDPFPRVTDPDYRDDADTGLPEDPVFLGIPSIPIRPLSITPITLSLATSSTPTLA